MKKYYILVLTFLSFFVGQSGFAQDWKDMGFDTETNAVLQQFEDAGVEIKTYTSAETYIYTVNHDSNPNNNFSDYNGDGNTNTADMTLFTAMSEAELNAQLASTNQLREVVVIGYHNYNSISISNLYYINYSDPYYTDPYDMCVIHYEYCSGGGGSGETNNPPPATWFRDNDEDNYDSGIRNQVERPAEEGNWINGTSKGTDCDDAIYNKDNVCYVPLTDPCLKANLDAILNASSSTNVFTKLFNDNFGTNLGCVINFIQYSNPNKTNIDAFAQQTGSDSFDLKLNLAALDYASDEYIRATIYHEIIHNYLTIMGIKDELIQHEEMEKNWRTLIANQLKLDFPNLSDADATGLSWGGLGATTAYQKMLADDLLNNTGITGAIAASNKNFRNLNNTNTTTYGTICN